MRKLRCWVFGLLVVSSGASCALAQSGPPLSMTATGAAIFEALVAAFEGELRSAGTGTYLGAAAELRATLYAGTAELGLAEVEAEEHGQVCAYLVGGGGNPRLDGGGDVLAQRQTSAFRGSAAVRTGDPPAPSADAWPTPGRRIVIIDEFDLTALATSVRGLIDTYGAVPIDPKDEGRGGLWSALYGYRLALAGPGVDPSTISVPHGHLVAFHALANLGQQARVTDVVLVRNAWHTFERAILTVEAEWDPENVVEIHLVAVDFADLGSIGQALHFFGSTGGDFVITSWGFVDCALAERYGEYVALGSPTATTIAEFWEEAFAAAGPVQDLLADLCAAFEGAIRAGGGPALDCSTPEGLVGLATIGLIADVSARSAHAISWDPVGNTRYFASAGNQGLAIPMPPAAWPGVYGVEACVARDNPAQPSQRATFSNAGGVGEQPFVRALGAWFVPPVADRGTAGGPPALGYWGTSYAAPTAAVIASTISNMGTPFYFEPCANP